MRIPPGGVEYAVATVTDRTGLDITTATITMGLSSSTLIPPAEWVTPDVDETIDSSTRRVKMLIDSAEVTGSWRLWVRVGDTPEVILAACVNDIIQVG